MYYLEICRLVKKVSAVREEGQLLEGMVEEGKSQLKQLKQELQPLAKQVILMVMGIEAAAVAGPKQMMMVAVMIGMLAT